MNATILKPLVYASLCAIAVPAAIATPVQRADISSEPNWVAHLDVDALRPTSIGQFLLSEAEKPEAQNKLNAFKAVFGVDLRKQVHGITLYSPGSDPAQGVLMAYADFDPDRLTTLAKAAKDYKSTTHGKHVIQSWIDEKKKAKKGDNPRTYAAIQGSRIIFSSSEDAVATALDVLDGSSPALSSSKAFPQLGAPSKGVFIQAAAHKVQVPDQGPHAAILKLTKSARFQASEAQDKISAILTIDGNDEEVAKNIMALAQGLVALLKLQQDNPDATKLANALNFKQDGSSVVVELSLPSSEVVEILKQGAAKHARKNEKD